MEFEKIIVLLFTYITDCHERFHITNGDIKPANVFSELDGAGFITFDFGSVMILQNDDSLRYKVTTVTQKYASSIHTIGAYRTKEELKQEDWF